MQVLSVLVAVTATAPRTMRNYTAKDAARTVNPKPSGWVGAIPTFRTIYIVGSSAGSKGKTKIVAQTCTEYRSPYY